MNTKTEGASQAGNPPEVPAMRTATELFHAHLNVCAQCRDHPMNLCSVGAKLLTLAATDSEPPVPGDEFLSGDVEDAYEEWFI